MPLCIICGIDKEKLFKNKVCSNSCKAKLENTQRKKVICPTCEYEFTETQLSTHACKGIKHCEYCNKRLGRRKGERFCSIKCSKQTKYELNGEIIDNSEFCIFCNKKCKNHNSLLQHSIRCKLNPEAITSHITKWTVEQRIKQAEKSTGRNKGLPSKISPEGRLRISKCNIERNKNMWTEEKRLEHADIMQRVVQDNPLSYTKHSKGISELYTAKDGNTYFLLSSWESAVARLLDSENIKWTNKIKNGFIYEFENKKHKYYPDFYLSDYNIYIEVKGRYQVQDGAKWEQFPLPLIIIMPEDYKRVQKNTYDIYEEIKKVNRK